MKTKTYLRYISCVLAVLLCVASIMPIAFADSTNHGNSESLLTGSNYSVSYSMNGKDVVEQLTIRDGGITRITRTVHPNDVMDIVVVGASGESTTSTARSDYSLFYEIYQDQQNYKNGQLAQIPALTGSEVTGSQFKHRYVGTSATDTVYAPLWAIVLGAIAGVLTCLACGLKCKLGYDDSLDGVGVHGVGGFTGTVLIGFFGEGTGLFAGGDWRQLVVQLIVALVAIVWSAVITGIIAFALEKTIGWRVTEAQEVGGIDLADQGERAYDFAGTASSVLKEVK